MLLNEISKSREIANTSTLNNRHSISEWLWTYCPNANFVVNDDLSVDVKGSINFSSAWTTKGLLTELPIKFNFIGQDFRCMEHMLTSFKNFPNKVGRSLFVRDNEITSLEGITSQVSEAIYMSLNKIKSFHNIHKQIKYVTRISCDPDVTHLLGLLKIPTLEEVDMGSKPEVQSIINKYLRGSRDVYLCQNDLIAAGFIEQAKL